MRILGVDPGSRKAGWGIVDVDGRRIVHVDNGVWMLPAKKPLAARLDRLAAALIAVVVQYAPDVAAVEDVFVHKGPRAALVLGQARGAVLAALAAHGLAVHGIPTARVKARVAGHGAASKGVVQEMVRAQLRLPEVPFEDAADALAVAVCCGLDDGVPPALQAKRARRSSSSSRGGFAALARAQGKL